MKIRINMCRNYRGEWIGSVGSNTGIVYASMRCWGDTEQEARRTAMRMIVEDGEAVADELEAEAAAWREAVAALRAEIGDR